jgi:hypothetical protein
LTDGVSERGERNDDATTPVPGDREATATEKSAPANDAVAAKKADPARRRRRLIIGGVAALAVGLVLASCIAAVALVRSGARLADRVDDSGRRQVRLDEACLELETRLNRLSPPGATGGDPRRRAQAVRDENTALRPLLVELESMDDDRDDWDDRHEGRDGDWASGWRQLVEARTAYADALDRQAAAGEPAFFLAPQAASGGAVIELLERRGPDTCAGAVRRLGHPDL